MFEDACNEHYGCRCQSKMLAPLSLDDLLARRIGCRILEADREVETKKKFVVPRVKIWFYKKNFTYKKKCVC